MHERLIEPAERWLYDRAGVALACAFALRMVLKFTLWGGQSLPWRAQLESLLDAPLIALLLLLALRGLAAHLAPRAYSAAVGLVTGGAAYLVALELLTRYGWPLRWPLGRAPLVWLVASAVGLLAVLAMQVWLRQRWLGQLGGHGIEWTRLWAQEQPYAARRLARRALQFRGAADAQ